ncbi:hypothetical protein [Rhizobium leucaenae]|uniref:hypothetical protein n=1 Tax=Rhizobium leucaenae TaxID=29450 RepID=UPI0007EE4361|nr:hypothetical protein [Rhizobium leucaenae]
MSNEQRPEQQAIPHGQEQMAVPLEVMNAELGAKLDFTERRLLAMSTVAFNLQTKCNELLAALAERTQEIAALRGGTETNDDAAAKGEVA